MPRATKELFDIDWLALREPVDHRSRAAALVPILQAAWKSRGWSRVLDLGSGTGSNLRYLAPRLPGTQAWTLLDHDPELLARVGVPESVRMVNRVCGDLADEGLTAVGQAHLVTCSALLDLVPEDWLRRLAHACCGAGRGALFALNYDGEIRWSAGARAAYAGHDTTSEVEDPDDMLVRQAVNAHQRRDRGRASALGPTASTAAEAIFREAGYRTWRLPSPWQLGPEDGELARALVDGWETAALELERRPGRVRTIHVWAERRRRTIAAGAFALTVGHQDLLALPPDSDDTRVHRRPDPVTPPARSTPIRGVATPRHTTCIPRRGALRLGALRTPIR